MKKSEDIDNNDDSDKDDGELCFGEGKVQEKNRKKTNKC